VGNAMVSSFFRNPRLTRQRIALALSVAVLADAVQVILGPLGMVLPDEVIDVAAMALISIALGFHPLLLPTFLIELFPLVEMLPTWTACTMAVIVMRRRGEEGMPRPPNPTRPAVVVSAPESTPSGSKPVDCAVDMPDKGAWNKRD